MPGACRVATRMSDMHKMRYRRVGPSRAAVAAVLLLPSATGCYTNVPVWEGNPTAKSEVTVGLSDRGRTVLATQLGPGVRTIRGHLERTTDSAFVLRVTAVEYISNATAGTWTGEEVAVSRELVSGVTERRFSRSRSWLVAGVVVSALALAATIGIYGFGNDPGSTKPPDGCGQQQ